jgi:integrase
MRRNGQTQRFSNFPGKLSLAEILAAGDGDHRDGNNLILRVRGPAASWAFRYTSPIDLNAGGKSARREFGLGSARRDSPGEAELAAYSARGRALSLLSEVMLGRDPKAERDAARATQAAELAAQARRQQREKRSLGAVIRLYHEREVEGAGTLTDKYCAQWIAAFENHLAPHEGGALWRRPIDEVAPDHLLDFLKVLQKKLPHTARKVRQRLDATFEYAMLKQWCDGNPTRAIARAIRRCAPSLKNTSHRALPYAQAPDLMQRLRTVDSTASRCLQFAVLTAARTAEAIGAEWSETDLQAGVWLIPAGRMKAGEPHRVDLSPQALAILQAQRGVHDRWVFPSPTVQDRPLSNMAMLTLLRRLGVKRLTTVHGLARGTFSTWANENGVARPDVIEAALAHREGDLIRAAYNKAQFVTERRRLLQAWADFLDGTAAPENVLDFPVPRAA